VQTIQIYGRKATYVHVVVGLQYHDAPVVSFPTFCLFSISGPYLVIWQTVWFCLLQVMHSKLVNGVASLYFLVIFHH
jgi:hypothetical protein